ncbi:hypothetical protein FA13DRAFT_1802256 [Coprinellus micaceus]|uniref:Uncharacterized protein n=1 Tax=Coprinellus micaceus TaxID=71717 RepID=A0A4Y7SCP0_COPMI|nr:hypothetical protein FA13DRAFT_1802256 [Coprinellus micaceus]
MLSEFDAFLRDNKAQLAPVFGRALRIINGKPQNATWDDIRFSVIGYQGVEFDPLAVLGAHVARKERPLKGSIATIAIARKGGCFNVTCPTASDTAGYAQLCGKCKMVRFCGVDDPMDSLDHSCLDRVTFILSLIHDVDPIHSCQFLRTASEEGVDCDSSSNLLSRSFDTPRRSASQAFKEMLVNQVLDTKTMLSLESAVELLATTMADPMKATACANRMHVAGMRINEGLLSCTSTAAKMKFARSFPQLLRAGIRFLTVNLPRVWSPSRTDDPEPKVPNQVHISEKIFLDNAVKVVINLIHIALAGLPKHEFLPNPKNDEIPPWPANAKDLFPFSLLDTIYGFDFWVEWFGIQGWEIYRYATNGWLLPAVFAGRPPRALRLCSHPAARDPN